MQDVRQLHSWADCTGLSHDMSERIEKRALRGSHPGSL